MGHQHHHHAPHSRGGRHRARRGAIVNATLLLLDEQPMHGYELITELESRSEGRWRPSPGTMYPALTRMEERGLVEAEEADGKKRFSLTDAGRSRLAEFREMAGDGEPAPWHDHGRGGRGELRGAVAELHGQARQIGRFGTPEQVEQAKQVFSNAKRELYAILATEPEAETEGSKSGSTADAPTGSESAS